MLCFAHASTFDDFVKIGQKKLGSGDQSWRTLMLHKHLLTLALTFRFEDASGKCSQYTSKVVISADRSTSALCVAFGG